MSGERIVSLVPSITELLCDLGLAGRLVGRTGFCIHPGDVVRNIPKVGGTKDVNVRRIRELAPTHVIVNVDENRRETVRELAEFVPDVIVTHPLQPLDNPPLYRMLGERFDAQGQAERLAADFEREYAALLAAEFPQRAVLYLIWRDPWMTVSRETYISATLALVGFQTVPAETQARYPSIDLDLVECDLVLLSSEPYHFHAEHTQELERLTGRPARLIDGEMTSWYGSRAISALRYLGVYARSLERAPPIG